MFPIFVNAQCFVKVDTNMYLKPGSTAFHLSWLQIRKTKQISFKSLCGKKPIFEDSRYRRASTQVALVSQKTRFSNTNTSSRHYIQCSLHLCSVITPTCIYGTLDTYTVGTSAVLDKLKVIFTLISAHDRPVAMGNFACSFRVVFKPVISCYGG